MSANPLLGPKEIGPVLLERSEGASEIVLVCEHASKKLPASLGNLGLGEEALASHIGWDIGALGVARRLSEVLNATLISQAYSRLAYDCNRPPESAAAVPERSEVYAIPGNFGLSQSDRQARVEALYAPFHQAIDDLLDKRVVDRRKPILVTIHSFTPVYFGAEREGKLGILHDSDTGLADALLGAAIKLGMSDVRRNYPYGIADGVTHTLQRHGVSRGIANVMIEIRNDLIATETGQAEWGDVMSQLLGEVANSVSEGVAEC